MRQDTRAITSIMSHIQHSGWGPSSCLHATSQQQGPGAEHSSSACREKQLIALTKTPVTTDNRCKQCPHLFLSRDELPKQSSEPSPSAAAPQSSPGRATALLSPPALQHQQESLCSTALQADACSGSSLRCTASLLILMQFLEIKQEQLNSFSLSSSRILANQIFSFQSAISSSRNIV